MVSYQLSRRKFLETTGMVAHYTLCPVWCFTEKTASLGSGVSRRVSESVAQHTFCNFPR